MCQALFYVLDGPVYKTVYRMLEDACYKRLQEGMAAAWGVNPLALNWSVVATCCLDFFPFPQTAENWGWACPGRSVARNRESTVECFSRLSYNLINKILMMQFYSFFSSAIENNKICCREVAINYLSSKPGIILWK